MAYSLAITVIVLKHDCLRVLFSVTESPQWQIRLNGSTPQSRQGRLEVFYNGSWGTVCHHWFDDADARVACNSLGYGSVLKCHSSVV
jgi:hypothetical protein